MKTQIEDFKDVLNFLSEIPWLNQGGCGISAYSMYLWLKQRDLITDSFKFVLCYESYVEENYLNNSNVLRNHNGHAIAPTHMVIYHDNQYLDSNGIHDISDYQWIQQVNEEWFIQNCINNLSTWNDMFDRKKYVPIIEEALQIKLNIEL